MQYKYCMFIIRVLIYYILSLYYKYFIPKVFSFFSSPSGHLFLRLIYLFIYLHAFYNLVRYIPNI